MQPDRFYHYYNRANGNENLFREEKNYQYFLQLLRKYIPPVADIYSYCLLPNHFHLVLKTKEEQALPESIRTGKRLLRHPFSNMFNAYAKSFNKTYDRRGSLFQKHPKHLEIDNNRYLRELILYVNCNAAHHNICEAEYYATHPIMRFCRIVRQRWHEIMLSSCLAVKKNWKVACRIRKEE